MDMNNLLLSMLEGRLKSQNYQLYQQYMNMKNSGQSPEQALNTMLKSGMVSQQDIQQAQNLAKQYNKNPGTPSVYNGKKF